jgi:RNA polymerase-binding transcription factor DksA
MLPQEQHGRIRRRLTSRLAELRADIHRELRKCDDETYQQLANHVADSGDQSVADLLVDVNLAEITRDVGEIRDVEDALTRLATGSYGTCVACEEPIGTDRLEYSPSAARCYRCQEAYENRERKTHHRMM